MNVAATSNFDVAQRNLLNVYTKRYILRPHFYVTNVVSLKHHSKTYKRPSWSGKREQHSRSQQRDFPYRLNFNLGKKNEIYHHS